MENKLTEKERKFLKRLYKHHEKIHYNYIAIGFFGCISILGLILGIKFHSKDGFLMAIYFGTMSIMLALPTRTESQIIRILKKLQRNGDSI